MHPAKLQEFGHAHDKTITRDMVDDNHSKESCSPISMPHHGSSLCLELGWSPKRGTTLVLYSDRVSFFFIINNIPDIIRNINLIIVHL